MSIRRFCLIYGPILVLAGFLAGTASAQANIKVVNAKPTRAYAGPELYSEFCAVCHGTDGKGTGPAAPALRVAAADLTTISRHNNNQFPKLKIQQIIKGDASIPAHGSLDMPTWGNIFKSISSSKAFAEMRVNSLVTYLEGIQR
jgi:mono/diheme cytochrome c family protein